MNAQSLQIQLRTAIMALVNMPMYMPVSNLAINVDLPMFSYSQVETSGKKSLQGLSCGGLLILELK